MHTYIYPKTYDCIVIGGGHAGCEAALAAARMGCSVLMLTGNLDAIARMSCNPAIGGIAKGHLVREIDALGGEMGKNTDVTGIQFKVLNRKKGPAVWSSRAQADKLAYSARMKRVLEEQAGLDLKQEMAARIMTADGSANTVECLTGNTYHSAAVIVATGTFLNGLIHIGESSFSAGRAGESAAVELAASLQGLGFQMGRLKTGTPPRLNAKGIDVSGMVRQDGDTVPLPFSFSSGKLNIDQVPCYITHTTESTVKIIRDNLHRSPLYGGRIKGTGVRYCPSIEDKVVRFPDKPSHQIFIEPEGRHTAEVYLNGVSTSLPYEVQVAVVRSIEGLERAEIMRPGYAVEYDYVLPTQLYPTLETKSVRNIFLAGQINGTSGYEEAAAQGIMAGINAALRVKGREAFVLDRSEAYIGVLIDDLVTKGTNEPYRMFTSRAEYRLFLRQDNADIRLMPCGRTLGLISDAQIAKLDRKKDLIREGLHNLAELRSENMTAEQLLRRPEMSWADLPRLGITGLPDYDAEVIEQIESEVKYAGYLKRQLEDIERFRKMESLKIPGPIDYSLMHGLKKEAREKLQKIRPVSLGQAARISGITPADVSILMIFLARESRLHPQ
ncbi:MAG: tRNA uridine-5-carboxymethylaminomethyl(34) synthesis enzyme MnmG [Chlamydiota bacterium]